jgi:hypothetical protein
MAQSISTVSRTKYERMINVYVLYRYCIDIVEIMEYNCHIEN